MPSLVASKTEQVEQAPAVIASQEPGLEAIKRQVLEAFDQHKVFFSREDWGGAPTIKRRATGSSTPFLIDLQPVKTGGKIPSSMVDEIGRLAAEYAALENLTFARVIGAGRCGHAYVEAVERAVRTRNKKGGREVVLIVNGVLTTGSSMMNAAQHYDSDNIHMLALVDTEEGGLERLRNKSYNVHCVLTATEVVRSQLDRERISAATASIIFEHIERRRNFYCS